MYLGEGGCGTEAGKTGAGAAGGIPVGVGAVGVAWFLWAAKLLLGSLVLLGRRRPLEGLELRTSRPRE